ncbi:MAG: peptidyl-alpha-hydroxyglycine alpha-amidating lyase family protein [Planctomycetaceae bacterium]
MAVGTGSLTFEAVPGWPDVPQAAGLIEAIGVAVDSQDLIYVFARADIPLLVFETDGTFVRGWGQGQFVRPHGISIGEDDTLYLVDDMGHSVRQFTGDGQLIRTIGPSGAPSDTGADGFDYRTIRPDAGPPFNLPTNLIIGPAGDLFITDGYGNARVHRFSAAGELIQSWGSPGNAPGQFHVPHGIASDGERLYVADRENSRVQIFTPDGRLTAIWEDLARPAQVHVDPAGHVFVFELGFHTGVFPWHSPDTSRPSSRMSIFDREGTLLTRWGSHGFPQTPEEFYAAHDMFLDSAGSLYTAEVKAAAAECVGHDTSTLPSLRKFVRCSQAGVTDYR